MTTRTSPVDPASSEPLVGTVVAGRYRVQSLLDEGARGRVYLARVQDSGRMVALKVLRDELTRVPEAMARFEREAIVGEHLHHPGIVSGLGSGKLEDGSVFLALEYINGHTLRAEIDKGPMPARRALLIARQIALALGAAHELDIVHRDLKPDNVMLVTDESGPERVKLLDFGVAKVPLTMADARPLAPGEGALITAAGMVFGTPDYMAPEQALGQPVDARADLYSLGVVLYELLTGTRPFKNEHDVGILGQQLSGEIPPMAQRRSGIVVPSRVEKLVALLLANEPRRRVSSTASLVERIDELLDSELSKPATSGEAGDDADDAEGVGETIPAPAMPKARVSAPPNAPGSSEAKARPSQTGPIAAPPSRSRGLEWELFAALALVGVVGAAGYLLYQSRTQPAPVVSAPVLASAVEPRTPTQSALPPASEPELAGEPTPSVEVLTDEHVEEALKAGSLAIDALLKRYPEDGRAHLAVARHSFKQQAYRAALGALATALRLDPALSQNEHVVPILWKGAQLVETREVSLELLKGPMQARGADVLYDLATSVPLFNTEIARLAGEWLDTRGFERSSTPEASVAAALFRAPNCRIRAALVLRAKNVGDQRSAVQLRRFLAGKGCRADEERPCNACLKGSAEVEQALAAIDARHPASTRGE